MSLALLKTVFKPKDRHNRGGVTIQYLSDLHLEAFGLYEGFEIAAASRYLLLGGGRG